MDEHLKTVLVTGDVMMEGRFAESRIRGRADSDAFDPSNYMEIFTKPVGAVSVGAILTRTLAGLPSMSVGKPRPKVLAPDRDTVIKLHSEKNVYWKSYAICAQVPRTKDGSEKDVVWRVKHKLGLDRKEMDAVPPELFGSTDDGAASLVIVEQSQQGFMDHDAAWPSSLKSPVRDDAWVLVEWSRPRFEEHSQFWAHLVKHFARRIVVLVTAEDLRLAGMRFSRGLSWERTASELYDDVCALWKVDPARFQACAYLVVSFGTSGAVLFWSEGDDLRAKLVYDPRYVEEQWATAFQGTMSGTTRCLTCGVALEMIRHQHGAITLSGEGLKAGVIAARRLLQVGFEAVGHLERTDTELPGDLRFPAAAVARVLRSVVAERNVVLEVREAARVLRIRLGEPGALESAEAVVARLRKVLEHEDLETQVLEDEVRRVYADWVSVSGDEIKPLPPKDDPEYVERTTIKRRAEERLVERLLRFIAPDDDARTMAGELLEQEIKGIAPGEGQKQWSILRDQLPSGLYGGDEANKILEKFARPLVIWGEIDGPWPFPIATIGKLFITNSEELERLSAVRELMMNYMNSTAPNPLSIAVFGAPGSGKSFAIDELASGLSGPQKITPRTFNLSQFSGPEAIATALHQVRDDGLAGKMPLVFWDEFDTDFDGELGWLRYFLAPMQDGIFQDESMSHNVGRAIFVFAGGTHENMGQLRKKAEIASLPEIRRPDEMRSDIEKAVLKDGLKWRKAKVPDFVSRLKGFIDIQSLNYKPLAVSPPESEAYEIDAATALRRAQLLREFLKRSAGDLEQMMPQKEKSGGETRLRQQLNVDPGVIGAFLGVRKYKYGARSMEAIVKMSALSGRDRYDRSALPPAEQLALHVDAKQFLQYAHESWPARARPSTT